MPSDRRRPLRWAAAAVVLVAGLVLPARAAQAHASVVDAQPADGAVLPTAPREVTLRFDERVDPSLASFRLERGAGTIDLAPVRAGAGGSELVASLPPLGDGVYRVAYRVRDPIDLHLTAGTIVFGVGEVSVAAGGGDVRRPPSGLDVALRWVERVGLALALGGALLALVLLPRLGARPARSGPSGTDDDEASGPGLGDGSGAAPAEVPAARRALDLVTLGAAAQLVALVGLFAREVVDIGAPYPTTMGRLVSDSSFGRRLVGGAIVAAALAAAARLLRPLVDGAMLARWRTRRLGELGWALAVMAVAPAVLVGLAGHSSTGGSYTVGVALRVVHLVAMGAWVGGLVGVVALRSRVHRPGALVAELSRTALVAVAVVVVTGLLLTGREVATVTALLASWFGRLLLAKLAVLALAAVWGVRHARGLRRAAAPTRRGLRIEAALAVVVVAGGAALSTTTPAVGAYYRAAPDPAATAAAQTIGDLVLKLDVRPNRPGPNLVRATVASTRRPELAPIVGVAIDLRPLDVEGIAPVTATAAAPVDGRVDFGQMQLAAAGRYQVEVQVDRPGAPIGLAIFQWVVDVPSTPRARTVVSDAAVAPWANGGAVVAALVGMTLVLRRRRHPVRVPADGADVTG